MPELPEVETTVNGIRPYLQGKIIGRINVRERKLRWPVNSRLDELLRGKKVTNVSRRGKYILVHIGDGGLIIHLGMSGSMRVLLEPQLPGKHDHFDIINNAGEIVRFRDPRKFGCLLFSKKCLYDHERIQSLGVEPLTEKFNDELLYHCSRSRSIPVKTLIMDGRIVVGVGNIYASEALYNSGIHPSRICSKISIARYRYLVASIKHILQQAIKKGGTTLQDFVGVDGSPGYFEQRLAVYGREGESCLQCRSKIKRKLISQRSTFYCPKCQR